MRRKYVDTIIPVKFNSELLPEDVDLFKSKLAELSKDLDIEISVLLKPEDVIGARIVCNVCGEEVKPALMCWNCLRISNKEKRKELKRKEKEERERKEIEDEKNKLESLA